MYFGRARQNSFPILLFGAGEQKEGDIEEIQEVQMGLSSHISPYIKHPTLPVAQLFQKDGAHIEEFTINNETAVFDVARSFWVNDLKTIYYQESVPSRSTPAPGTLRPPPRFEVDVNSVKSLEPLQELPLTVYEVYLDHIVSKEDRDLQKINTGFPLFFEDIPVHSSRIEYNSESQVLHFEAKVRPEYAAVVNAMLEGDFRRRLAKFIETDKVVNDTQSRLTGTWSSQPTISTSGGVDKDYSPLLDITKCIESDLEAVWADDPLRGIDPSLALMMHAVRYRTRVSDWCANDPQINARLKSIGPDARQPTPSVFRLNRDGANPMSMPYATWTNFRPDKAWAFRVELSVIDNVDRNIFCSTNVEGLHASMTTRHDENFTEFRWGVGSLEMGVTFPLFELGKEYDFYFQYAGTLAPESFSAFRREKMFDKGQDSKEEGEKVFRWSDWSRLEVAAHDSSAELFEWSVADGFEVVLGAAGNNAHEWQGVLRNAEFHNGARDVSVNNGTNPTTMPWLGRATNTTILFRTLNEDARKKFLGLVEPGQISHQFQSQGKTYFVVSDPSEELKSMANPGVGQSIGLESAQLFWKYTVPKAAFRQNEFVENLIVPKGMTHIDDIAFEDSHLREIKLPKSLQSIGIAAFQRCRLTSLELPPQLRIIDNYAFRRCRWLEGTLKLPKLLDKIGNCAFEEVDLVEVLFEQEDYNPMSETVIGKRAFYHCRYLQIAKLPPIKVISEKTFCNCMSLHTVKLADHLQTIEPMAFSGCRNLQTIEFPTTLQKIGKKAFANCTSLTKVTLPQYLNYIDDYAFDGCEALRRLDATNSNMIRRIGKNAFRQTNLDVSRLDQKLQQFISAFENANYRPPEHVEPFSRY